MEENKASLYEQEYSKDLERRMEEMDRRIEEIRLRHSEDLIRQQQAQQMKQFQSQLAPPQVQEKAPNVIVSAQPPKRKEPADLKKADEDSKPSKPQQV